MRFILTIEKSLNETKVILAETDEIGSFQGCVGIMMETTAMISCSPVASCTPGKNGDPRISPRAGGRSILWNYFNSWGPLFMDFNHNFTASLGQDFVGSNFF